MGKGGKSLGRMDESNDAQDPLKSHQTRDFLSKAWTGYDFTKHAVAGFVQIGKLYDSPSQYIASLGNKCRRPTFRARTGCR